MHFFYRMERRIGRTRREIIFQQGGLDIHQMSDSKTPITESVDFHKTEDPAVSKEKNSVDYTKGDVEEYKYYPDNPTSNYHQANFVAKGPSKYYDPCQESSKMSFRCLELNNYDRDLCLEYFKAYRECKKEWLESRRQNGRAWKVTPKQND